MPPEFDTPAELTALQTLLRPSNLPQASVGGGLANLDYLQLPAQANTHAPELV
jgi:hypothetical protein